MRPAPTDFRTLYPHGSAVLLFALAMVILFLTACGDSFGPAAAPELDAATADAGPTRPDGEPAAGLEPGGDHLHGGRIHAGQEEPREEAQHQGGREPRRVHHQRVRRGGAQRGHGDVR